MIVEEIAPGDRAPLHRHPVDEVVFVVSGSNQFTLGDQTVVAEAGSTVFVPAGVSHGQENPGPDILRIQALFPGTEIEIEMLERNPAPGAEGESPRRVVYDARTGEFSVLDG